MDLDDLTPILNPVRVAALTAILDVTPHAQRVSVMLAFCDLTRQAWMSQAGFVASDKAAQQAILRWANGDNRMPLGVAIRLARVIGVPAELLFSEQIRRREHLPLSRKDGTV